MQTSGKTISILLAIVAAILIFAALKATQPISMPLAFAGLIAVLVYPLQQWLERYVPHWLSLILVLLLLAAVLGLGVGALAFSIELVEPSVPEYLDRLQQKLQSLLSWAQQYGISVSSSSLQDSLRQFASQAISWVKAIWTTISLFILVVFLLILLLLEVGEYKEKAKRSFSSPTSKKVIQAFGKMTHKLRRFLIVQSFTSVLTGILTGLWCLILGVDFAFVWALVSFVLNFVPTLGSAIAIFPPTLLALLFNGAGQGLATFAGLAAIQLILGNFVDPRLQGRSLQLSPFIALVSIVFWSWVWGIPGAFIAVPMTVSVVVFLSEFKSTQSIAILLSDLHDSDS